MLRKALKTNTTLCVLRLASEQNTQHSPTKNERKREQRHQNTDTEIETSGVRELKQALRGNATLMVLDLGREHRQAMEWQTEQQ